MIEFLINKTWKGLFFLISVSISFTLYAESRIVVVYPEVRAPYDQLFLSAYEGVKSGTKAKVLAYKLKKGAKPEVFLEWMRKKKIDGVVALGNRGLSLVRKLKQLHGKSVIGMVVISPGDENVLCGISYSPSPTALFSHLRQLQSDIKKIRVIYKSGDQRWLVEQAKNAAQSLGIQLDSYPYTSLKNQAELYKNTLSELDSKTEALWLADSRRPLKKVLMNEVLQASWNRKIVVFSSNLAGVSSGVLFSLYPDNHSLGKDLVLLLEERLKKDKQKEYIVLTESLQAAINTRTAGHLGIRINTTDRQQYQAIFPLGR